MNKFFIIEGPDCSGKTSLAKAMCLQLNGVYWHSSGKKSLHRCMQDYHTTVLDSIEQNLDLGRVVVLDRHWPTEFVYATVLRPNLLGQYDFRVMTKRTEEMGATYIFCGDDEVQQRHRLLHTGMDHHYDAGTFAAICGEYRSLEEEFLSDRKHHYSVLEDGPSTHMRLFISDIS